MATQYIKATPANLQCGNIVIKCTNTGVPYGELMLCMSWRKEIKNTGKVYCFIHDSKGMGSPRSRYIKIEKLARVIDHRIRRKLKPEELFKP